MFIHVKTVAELELLIQESKGLVIDFYADWCGPCKKLGQYLKSIKDREEFKDIVFVKLNVEIEEFTDTCTKYEVTGLPHTVYFKDSRQVAIVSGFNEAKVLASIKNLC